jgi:formate dehydrogenase subunit gamma
VTTTIDRVHRDLRPRLDTRTRIGVRSDELLRHPLHTRILHWSAAGFFTSALLSGFAIYSPWLFHWIAPLLGGAAAMRVLHPWFGLGFVLVFAAQAVNWRHVMVWTRNDARWLRRLGRYITNADRREPAYVGFFNAGQKLYFWTILAASAVFLISGVPMWFPETFGRPAVATGLVFHDLAALAMVIGFVIHVYEATVAVPGTFSSMIRGTVKKRWAWAQHPAWFRWASGRYARAPYDGARHT